MQLIKGESSFWANKNALLGYKLEWAEDYFAASVSESAINKVRDYINNQEEHHRKISFNDEYEKFVRSFGFNWAKAPK
jgi:putative transposase